MEAYFVEYLLDALDERTRRQVEAYLAQSAGARRRLALLKETLAPLSADAEAPAPPPLLVERTLARVAEHACAALPAPAETYPASADVFLPSSPRFRSWWRRADVLVAACILFTVLGIGLIVLGRMRGPSSAAMLVECSNNLRMFHAALQTYRDHHGQFPDVTKQSPRDVAGMVVPILNEAGVLPSSTSIRCPGVGSPQPCPYTVASLRAMSDTEFSQSAPNLSMCYAYSLGFHAEGVYHGPAGVPASSFSQTPLMSDRPPAAGVLHNSINHDGAGQNVLFADGHVRFFTVRTFGQGDDIFLNRRNQVAAGLDARDIVLGYSAARP